MIRKLMNRYEVKTYGYFVVAMDKRTRKDDVEEEAFRATNELYKHDSNITIVDTNVTSYKTEEYFTFAEVTLDMRVRVDCHDYEECFGEAEGCAEDVDTPVGVSLIECQAYDYEEIDTWEV